MCVHIVNRITSLELCVISLMFSLCGVNCDGNLQLYRVGSSTILRLVTENVNDDDVV